MGNWYAIEWWFLQRLTREIRLPVDILVLPLRPLYNNMSVLSLIRFWRDSHFKRATISWSLSLSDVWISWNWPGREVSIFSRVGKCTSCFKPWSFNEWCLSTFLSDAEPDLLSLCGQSISLKLKSPKTWTEGRFLPSCRFLIWSSWYLNSWKSPLVPHHGNFSI